MVRVKIMEHKLYLECQDILIFKKSRLKETIKLLFALSFFIIIKIWFDIQLSEPILTGIIIILLFSIIEIYRSVKVIFLGETYSFNKITKNIYLNNKELLSFDDLNHIQVQTIEYSEQSDEHSLSLIDKEGKKFLLIISGNRPKILNWAYEIAEFIGSNVHVKK